MLAPARWKIVAALLVGSFTTSACTGSSSVIYEASDAGPAGAAVSSLQTIAILPAVFDISPEDPAACMEACLPDRDQAEMILAVDEYLRDDLGYATLCFDYACRRIPDNPFTDEQLTAWSQRLVTWARANQGAGGLPSELADVVGEIRSAFGVDGVLLVHGGIRYVQDADMAHWLATLTFSMYYNMTRGNTGKITAEIYDASSGRKLWAAASTVLNVGKRNMMAPVEGARDRYGASILGELDYARAPE